MNFIAPANLLFAGLLGAILVLYILRLRRKERTISSTLLWETALRDLQANSPWQKLRSSLLMWVQMLFILLAVLALARPAIKVLSSGGQTAVVILDASGSMAATDISPSRFERARSEAQTLVNRLSSRDQAAVIQAGAQTRVLSPLTSDKIALTRALNSARTQDTTCNLREAVSLAGSLLKAKRNARIYIMSDGAVEPLRDPPSKDIGLEFVKIGQQDDNLALTAMDARRPYGGGNAQIFATVRNFSKQDKDVNLELSHDGDLVEVAPLRVKKGEQTSYLFDDLRFSSGLFKVSFDNKDDLNSDNTAYATLSAPQALKVLLVSQEGSLFLERALGLNEQTQVTRATPDDLKGGKVASSYDVVVCDGVAPDNLPDGPQLVFNAITPLCPVQKTGIVESPTVADYDRKNPVTRFAPWNDVRFAQSTAVKVLSWGTPVVEAERTPLMVAGEKNGRRVVWCGFDLRETDLTLRVAFPIFVTNAVQWLASGRSASDDGAARRAGDVVQLNPPPQTKTLTITGPDKATRTIAIGNLPALYDGADRVGVYTASSDNWKQTFAVSLLNRTESDLQPRDALQVGETGKVGGESRARSNRELWGYIALLALGLLGLEWWIYHRGV